MENETLVIREACIDDAKLLFDWRNDPIVRQQSFSEEEIDYGTHLAWVKAKLQHSLTKLYIVEYAETPIAQVRFDLKVSENSFDYAIISISIDANFRGKGLGKFIISDAINKYYQKYSNAIIAYVKNDNIASLNSFKRAGFKEYEGVGISNELNSKILIFEKI